MEDDSKAYELVSSKFSWSEKRNGFAIESHEALKAFKLSEIDLLRHLQNEGLLEPVGSFGFIVVQKHEALFFSKTEIDAVRPPMTESRNLAGYAFMVDLGSKELAREAVEMLFKGNVWQACRFIDAIAEDGEQKVLTISKLATLENDQGTKFSFPSKDAHAELNFIAEVVEDQFRLWISWNPSFKENMKENEIDVVRMLTGRAIMLDCMDNIAFMS